MGMFTRLPEPVLERLLKDIAGAWNTRGTDTGLLIKVTDGGLAFGDATSASPTVVSGPLASVVKWAARRGSASVTAVDGAAAPVAVPAAAKWI
ncbi:hypothetical protein [Pseudarthrobacter sp. PvP090]|uniref:hypothetical protein n=1 Tax=Pseudarthrobacter sp. PvP090 TaxID=3156393 RepID=UPI003398BEEF